MPVLTQKRLKQLLHYDKNTGEFVWLETRGRVKKGRRAGGIDHEGYEILRIDTVRYRAHRVAFLYVLGRWPREEIDHINKNRADNRFKNLREASHHENCKNVSIQKRNKSGTTGVFWNSKINKWCARIRHKRKDIWLGTFSVKKKAVASRKAAEKRLKFHANHGT